MATRSRHALDCRRQGHRTTRCIDQPDGTLPDGAAGHRRKPCRVDRAYLNQGRRSWATIKLFVIKKVKKTSKRTFAKLVRGRARPSQGTAEPARGRRRRQDSYGPICRSRHELGLSFADKTGDLATDTLKCLRDATEQVRASPAKSLVRFSLGQGALIVLAFPRWRRIKFAG